MTFVTTLKWVSRILEKRKEIEESGICLTLPNWPIIESLNGGGEGGMGFPGWVRILVP